MAAKETTPMFRQYAEHKEKHKDAVLFFRMGDFYEMFKSDAVEVSRLLNLTLTQRQGIPMCGIPYHAAGNYIGRLLKAGKKIAICEQVELPQNGRGLAKREVVEVVTPGTVVDDSYLDDKSNNYLAALGGSEDALSFGFVDLSTGEFGLTLIPGGAELRDSVRKELARSAPRELIIQESLAERRDFAFLHDENFVVNRLPDWSFDIATSRERLTRQFGTINLKAFGLKSEDPRLPAAGVLIDYLEDNARTLLPHIRQVNVYGEEDAVGLDEATIRNLELVRNLQDGGRAFTLLESLDYTKTAPGARLLKRRLLRPSRHLNQITDDHQRVETLYRDQHTLSSLREILSGVLDLERLTARVAMERAHAKDLLAIRDTLSKTGELAALIPSELIQCHTELSLSDIFETASNLSSMLSKSISEDPSILLTEGRLIRRGWNEEIDSMREKRDHGKQFLDAYVAEERAATGINTLKLKYNRLLGYFLEVSKTQSGGVPARFRRRQSLVGAERFSTDRLEGLESELNSVGEILIEKEKKEFLLIRDRVKGAVQTLLAIAEILSDIDVIQSFAHAATIHGYTKPEMHERPETQIRGGRHPVVENHLPQGTFVPNSISLGGDKPFFALVTGPNMAGKSTVLRQVALITLMAQCGSFVPADEAFIGIADRIFCRVGASDNLARGESTFLVEMNETANIIRNAGSQSLVIMDEVGRGTGTADGLAIAQAVCDYILKTIQSRTLFATHYRELTEIRHDSLVNLSMAVKEIGDQVVFPKTLVFGPAEASYGIHVAALAGLPSEVIENAKRLLVQIEKGTRGKDKPEISRNEDSEPRIRQVELFGFEEWVLDELTDLDIDSLTPLEALNLLSLWKTRLNS